VFRSRQLYPLLGAVYSETKRTWTFPGGATLKMRFLEKDKDVHRYQGHQYTWIGFDELTNWATDYCYLYMFSCARSAEGVPVRVRASGNPGSVGHFWVKDRFIDRKKPFMIYRDTQTGLTRCFIPARLDDNTKLQTNDPLYEVRLKALPKHLYEAYRFGRWDIFIGQAFNLSEEHHIINPMPIPANAMIYMTMDWGFGAPFSIGWWWVDNDGRLYRFMEWYGWSGKPNEGMRLNDSEIAEGIIRREQGSMIAGRPITRILSPDCFSKKPDYKGGGQAKSTSEVFAGQGLYCIPGDPNRELGIRQFRERLRVKPEERPMMLIYNTCEHFIRTIPVLQTDVNNPEDVDTDLEDHVYDETKLICNARPIAMQLPTELQFPNLAAARVDKLESEASVDALYELYGLNDEEERFGHDGFISTVE